METTGLDPQEQLDKLIKENKQLKEEVARMKMILDKRTRDTYEKAFRRLIDGDVGKKTNYIS